MTVLEDAAALSPDAEDLDRPVADVVADHLGADPSVLPALSKTFLEWQRVALQCALEACITRAGWDARLVGVQAPPVQGVLGYLLRTPPLAVLLASSDVAFGAPEYVRLPSGPGQETACLDTGILLLTGPEGPVVVAVRADRVRGVAVDVMAPTVARASAFLAELDRLMVEHNPFRGQYVSLSYEANGNLRVDYEEKPALSREEVILPDGVLDSIEAHAIGVTAQADRLRAAGRHLKRGLLLYGPPGTGKTHVLRYLASRLPEATMFVLTGSGMGMLGLIKEIVPGVAPAIVVLDDVDLIAEDRDREAMAPRQLLFTLLDTMDGIGEDADVLFVCTSNRADTLERAVAARPGRIDQAVEVGLPDDACRRRLIDLYAEGIDVRLEDPDAVVERTAGVTASFVKELLRRAWLLARREGEATVADAHVHAALDALLDPASPLTPALLGVQRPAAG